MVTVGKHVRVYLWKTQLDRRRSPCATCCEVVCPVIVIGILALLYNSVPLLTYRTTAYDDQIAEFTLQTPMYLIPAKMQAMQAQLGLVGPKALVDDFKTWSDQVFPGVSFSKLLNNTDYEWMDMAPFSECTRTFATEEELEATTQVDGYGTDGSKTVFAAIVFNSGPPHWDYTLRYNQSQVPSTGSYTNDFSRQAVMDPFNEYLGRLTTSNGPSDPFLFVPFVELQRLVDRYILNTRTSTPPGGVVNYLSTSVQQAIGNLRVFAAENGCSAGGGPPMRSQEEAAGGSGSAKGGGSGSGGSGSGVHSCPVPSYAELQKIQAELGLWASGSLYAPQTISAAPFPTREFTVNGFYSIAGVLFPFMFVIAFLTPVIRLIRGITVEKETRAREGMQMMGMSNFALIFSWYVWYGVGMAILSVLMTIVGALGMFQHSSPLVILLFFFLFGMASVSFCYLMTAFFDRAKTAAIIGTILYIATIFPKLAVDNVYTASSIKTASSLAAPTAFGLAIDVLANSESNNVGINFANLFEPYQGYSVGDGLVMLFVDIIVYTILGWYWDRVFPSEFGVRLPFYFPFTKVYWFGNAQPARGASRRGAAGAGGDLERRLLDTASTDGAASAASGPAGGAGSEADSDVDRSEGYDPASAAQVEPVAPALRQLAAENRCIKVRNLRKEFDTPDGVKVAVDNLNMTMYEGQIFALLGHNGAGKTTTLSMMTGLLQATSGSMSIYGHDVETELGAVRQNMGVCPQHDVLFESLTVEEHLQFFATVKGVPPAEIDAAVTRIIAEVGLTEKTNYTSGKLSGGQKRKLSVAIALIGGSKVVFLDEPTSGMDPYSRRSTWNILQNNREGRVIILTTHFMDEADLLGDRIAIMAEGQLRCLGSSNYLKEQYGVGYNLSIVKNPETCDDAALKSRVMRAVPSAQLLSNVGAEVTYQLPFSSSAAFPRLFEELERDSAAMGVETFGVGVTTLEEVFIRVAKAGNKRQQSLTRQASFGLAQETRRRASSAGVPTPDAPPTGKAPSSLDIEGHAAPLLDKGEKPFTRSVFCTHLSSLFLKRFRYSLRDKKAFTFQLLIPVLALLVSLALLKSSIQVYVPPLTLKVDPLNVYKLGSHAGEHYPAWNTIPYNQTKAADTWLKHFDASSTFPVPVPDIKAYLSKEAQWGGDCGDGGFVNNDDPAQEGSGCSNPDPIPYDDPLRLPVRAMSDYLLSTYDNYAASRYAAFIINKDTAVAAQDAYVDYTLLVNTTALHGLPLYLNRASEALLRWIKSSPTTEGAAAAADVPTITVSTHPLPLTKVEVTNLSRGNAILATLMIMLAFAFIPSSFAIFIVKEREVNAKHQQLISGVNMLSYWLATYLWDVCNYIVPCVLSLILVKVYDLEQFTKGDSFSAVALIFFGYGTSSASFTYVFSWLFQSHSSAQNAVLLLQFLNVIMMIVSMIMWQISEHTCEINEGLMVFYRLFPGFLLGDALMNIALLQALSFIKPPSCDRVGKPFNIHDYKVYKPFDAAAAGTDLVWMLGLSIGYLLLALAIEFALTFPAVRGVTPFTTDPGDGAIAGEIPDEDVAREAARVDAGGAKHDVIVLEHLRKAYKGGKVAVRNLSFGVPRGECFGFLGINGAGKTSTLKMLTGDTMPTSGTARLRDHDIRNEQVAVRRLLGYCPQFDALLDLLTVKEHLELYARIKGVPRSHLQGVVSQAISRMQLESYANKLAGSLSGGNKRKLSVAIAMLNEPPLMFLDEPSTGMDPVARRFMWQVISDLAKSSSIILTTHSMEECEALCQRVGIMVGGRLRCLGSVQHLKHRFGQGFVLQVTLHNPTEEAMGEAIKALEPFSMGIGRIPSAQVVGACAALGDPNRGVLISPTSSGWAVANALQLEGAVSAVAFAEWWCSEEAAIQLHAFVSATFPGKAQLRERQENHFTYHIDDLGMSLGQVFAAIEEVKPRLRMSQYSLSQTTLEEVFNSFAAQQEEERGVARGVMGGAPAVGAAVGPGGMPVAAGHAAAATG